MKPSQTLRIQRPARFRRARSDASLRSIQDAIESKFGLPEGSVRIVRPDGRKMRSDATVLRLKDAWES